MVKLYHCYPKDGLSKARELKQAKEIYISLLGDLNSLEYFAELETIEIGSLSHFSAMSVTSI